MSPAQIVQKLWNYCNVLRDDGMSYGDYVEQLTYLLFLKMADEHSKPPHNQESPIPIKYDWQSLLKKDGDELFDHYRHLLEELGKKNFKAVKFWMTNKKGESADVKLLMMRLSNGKEIGFYTTLNRTWFHSADYYLNLYKKRWKDRKSVV